MPSRAGVKLRPTLEREKLYLRSLQLRKEGLSYHKIIARIREESGEDLAKSTISGWLNEKHRPFGYVRVANLSPTAELAYLIGVRLGDASMSIWNYSYKVKLRVIDKEFAQEFSRCLSIVLGRPPPRTRWDPKKQLWNAEASSLLLYNLLSKRLSDLKPIIEHCDNCTSAFLRGFFDSEGWVSKPRLGIVNTNLPLLKYCQQLLEVRFGIQTLGPKIKSEGGRFVLIKGTWYHANKDCYEMTIMNSSFRDFQARIGFTLLRKSRRLSELTMSSF